jgi:hypothetical protein
MKKFSLLFALILSACESPSLQNIFKVPDAPAAVPIAVPAPTLDPTPPPPPPPAARTAAQFDTTTDEDRAAATAAVAPAGERSLGTTLATLGSPADPGIWLKTPLVNSPTQGRVDYNGTTINVELRPSGGAAGSGSQISLPAMRLLGAPLTGIVELKVYSG